jgi:hypothetical protein
MNPSLTFALSKPPLGGACVLVLFLSGKAKTGEKGPGSFQAEKIQKTDYT